MDYVDYTTTALKIYWSKISPIPTAMVAACPGLPEESDLVPGVYEGGLKVWEASLDLVEHLVCPNGGGGGGGGSGLFAHGEVMAVTGRRKSVLEVRRQTKLNKRLWIMRLCCCRFFYGVCVGMGGGF